MCVGVLSWNQILTGILIRLPYQPLLLLFVMYNMRHPLSKSYGVDWQPRHISSLGHPFKTRTLLYQYYWWLANGVGPDLNKVQCFEEHCLNTLPTFLPDFTLPLPSTANPNHVGRGGILRQIGLQCQQIKTFWKAQDHLVQVWRVRSDAQVFTVVNIAAIS